MSKLSHKVVSGNESEWGTLAGQNE
jgi:hypothetical protein